MNNLFLSILFICSVTFTQLQASEKLGAYINFDGFIIPQSRSIVINNDHCDNIFIMMEERQFMVYRLPLEGLILPERIKEEFNKVQDFSEYITNNELTFNSAELFFENLRLFAPQSVFCNATESLLLKNVLVVSPNILFKGDFIELCCLIEGNVIQLEPNNKNPYLSSIKFILKDRTELTVSPSIAAHINFNGTETSMFCIVAGVERVEITFSDPQ